MYVINYCVNQLNIQIIKQQKKYKIKKYIKYYTNKKEKKKRETKMCLVGGIRTATKSKGNVGVFQTDLFSTEPSMLIPCNAENTNLIYSVCRLLLKINC